MIGPGRMPKVPNGAIGQLCRPNTRGVREALEQALLDHDATAAVHLLGG